MKITLKNIKHSEFASHETHCFEASIYIDGKRRATVSNCGQGGCNDEHWDDRTVMDAVYDYVKTLPPVEVEWSDAELCDVRWHTKSECASAPRAAGEMEGHNWS